MTALELTDVLKEARSLLVLAQPDTGDVPVSDERWRERVEGLIPEINRAVDHVLDSGRGVCVVCDGEIAHGDPVYRANDDRDHTRWVHRRCLHPRDQRGSVTDPRD